MSLAIEYSSDDDKLAESVAKDAFGISSLSSNKRSRVEEPTQPKSLAPDAAPHVLAEVRQIPLLKDFHLILKETNRTL